MSWLRNNWPSFSNQWDLPFGTLTDLIGIGLGFVVLCLTIYVAFRQLQIMRRQTAMMEEQGRLAAEQTRLALKQDQIIEQQLQRRADLKLTLSPGLSLPGSRMLRRLYAMNKGNKTANEYTWELFCPLDLFDRTAFNLPEMTLEAKTQALGGNGSVLGRYMSGHRRVPVYPDKMSEIGTLVFDDAVRGGMDSGIYVRVMFEDGEYPVGQWDFIRVLLYPSEPLPVDNPPVDNSTSTT